MWALFLLVDSTIKKMNIEKNKIIIRPSDLDRENISDWSIIKSFDTMNRTITANNANGISFQMVEC